MTVRWTQEEYDRFTKSGDPAKITEQQFQAAVMKVASQLGWRFYHTHDSIGSQAGFPDLVLVRRGTLIFAELKTESGKVSKEQQAWLAALRVADQHAFVWRPSMMQRIVEVLT